MDIQKIHCVHVVIAREQDREPRKVSVDLCSIGVCDKCVTSGPPQFWKPCFLYLEDQRTSSEDHYKDKVRELARSILNNGTHLLL